MKKANIKTAMLLLVAAMTTAACSSNDAGDTASTVLPVSVTATVADMQTRATNITDINLADFGLYINPDKNATTPTWSSSQVTKVSESWTLATPITWDTEKAASVAAYAPYQTTSPITVPTTAGGAPTMALTANTTAGNEPTDWLYNYQASYSPKAATPLPVSFHHAMSRLRVKVSLNDELSGATVTQVYIGNLHAGGTLNMADGTITYSSTPDYYNIYATNKDESATNIYSAFLVPQTVTSSKIKLFIVVTLSNGKSYLYIYPNDATFEMGKAYGLSLTLGKNVVTLNGSGITGLTNWGDAASEPDL